MKPGKNDPCGCGSGKKFKHCCGSAGVRPAAEPAADVINQLTALYNARRYGDVESRARAVLLKFPTSPGTWKLLGAALQIQGKDALPAFLKVAELAPADADAHINLGNVQRGRGLLEDAAMSYRRALQLKPAHADAHNSLGTVLRFQGSYGDALECYRKALALKPNSAHYQFNLGTALKDLGRLEDALAGFRAAVALKPDSVESLASLGATLRLTGQFAEAETTYRRALELNPAFFRVHDYLGILLKDLDRNEEAIACYRRALEINPQYLDAHLHLGIALKDIARSEEAIECFQRALEINPRFAETYNYLLFTLNYSPDYNAEYCLQVARQYGQLLTEAATEPFTRWQCEPNPERLRVGFVTAELFNHPVAHFLESTLNNVDRSRFEFFAYPTYAKEDELTTRIRGQFSAWKPLIGMGERAAAELINADGIHILFDLSGHTAHNRMPVFAWRPAPVHVSWLGFLGASGVNEMDYILGDPSVTPLEDADRYSETLWQLPESYCCFTPPTEPLEVNDLPALKTGTVTFGSFNNISKTNDAVVAVWSKVLKAVPGSRLFLKTKQLGDPIVSGEVRKRFAAQGIGDDQLLIEGGSPRLELIASYNKVDIALDPFPYSGATTSAEALWMGVPVLSRTGDRFISRCGVSMDTNAGLADWIAKDDDEYVALAVKYASDLASLAALRARLRDQVLSSPLFDAPRFARNFETALWEMWRTRKLHHTGQ
jgi:predicted O-linked N-acetylglucosamine transferase (SPINDLY family)